MFEMYAISVLTLVTVGVFFFLFRELDDAHRDARRLARENEQLREDLEFYVPRLDPARVGRDALEWN